MQTIVQVICKKGTSLRDAIANDKKLDLHCFEIIQEKKQGRSPGWLKLKSTFEGRQGALNMQWGSDTNILTCRVVNRGNGEPSSFVGDFVDYLMARHTRRINAIQVLPQK